MITFFRIIILCFIPNVLFAASLTSDTVNKQVIPHFEKSIQQAMKTQGMPGAAIAIVSRDKIYYLKTFGVKRLGKKDAITPETLFQIGSLSKPINATMLAILQERGKLSLEDPVDRFIPFHLRNENLQLKICHLLSHSSGVSKSGFDGLIEAYAPRQQIIQKLQQRHPAFPPGKHFEYHNAMYGLVEDIITSASGKSLQVTLQEELFKPLGMANANLGLEPLLEAQNKAYPHVVNSKGRYIPADKYSSSYYSFSAAGGVNASILDLIPFLQLYLGNQSPIVSSKTLRQLTNPFVKNNRAALKSQAKKGVIANTFYGLGWNNMTYNNKKVIYHQGHLKGFRSFMGFVDDEVGIIILTNAERKHSSKLALKFFDLYLAEVKKQKRKSKS